MKKHIVFIGLVCLSATLSASAQTQARPATQSAATDTAHTTADSLRNQQTLDLLRKLPGIKVDSNGCITVHDEPVTKVMVNGHTFVPDPGKRSLRDPIPPTTISDSAARRVQP